MTDEAALSRTALKAMRLKPSPGQQPAKRVWSHRRREHIELFDPAQCVPMRDARPPSTAQLAALEVGRRKLTHKDCAGCGRNLELAALNRHGLCNECLAEQAVEDAEYRSHERRAEMRALIDAAPPSRTIYLDTETTGLDVATGDELLELALVDDAGAVLLDTLIRPTRRTEWPEAQAIHGIAPTDVADAPTLDAVLPALAAAIERAGALVIYNAHFDLGFLPDPLRSLATPKACCAMHAFALWSGEWDEHRQVYRYQKLQHAAARAGHVWDGRAHRAKADALAVRTVWQWLRTAATTAS